MPVWSKHMPVWFAATGCCRPWMLVAGTWLGLNSGTLCLAYVVD